VPKFSPHFEINQVAEGVYAAIATPGMAAGSNAGIIKLGNHTLVFDAFETPMAAADLRRAAEELSDRSPDILINSHSHDDHWGGNQAFEPEILIISTLPNRELILEGAEGYLDIAGLVAEIHKQSEKKKQRLLVESDPRWRTNLEYSLGRSQYILADLPNIHPYPPNLTFEDKLKFHSENRLAELIATNGHTVSDCYLLLPQERMCFTGDLAFFGEHPYMLDSDPAQWVKILEEFEQSNIDTFIPGHGPPGTKAEITLLKEYILELENLALEAHLTGGSADDAVNAPIPPPFDAWSGGITRYEHNMRFMYAYMTR